MMKEIVEKDYLPDFVSGLNLPAINQKVKRKPGNVFVLLSNS